MGAELEAAVDVGILTPGGEQDDPHGRRRRVLAEVRQDLESAQFGHHHVEDAEIGAFCLRQRESRLAVGCGEHPVAVVFQAETHEIQDVLFVIHHEYCLGRGCRGVHP